VWKITFKTCDFIDISNATIPTTLGGSTTTSPPIVVVILRQQLDYVIVDYAAPTTPHPIVTSQDFIKFWGNFFAFVLLEMIGNSQGFKTFGSI
jgi:hypothetical protein